VRRARLDRREFLQRSAALAGAVATGGLLGACGEDESPVTDLGELASTISGRVIAPGDRGYRAARLVWNARYDAARPLAVVEVADAADVRRTVDFARDRGLRLIPRSGAHSFAGYSTGGGVVLDLSRLSDVEVERGGERARLGGGCTTLPAYRALWPHRRAVSGGTCPTVGIPGVTAGGGLGVLSRRHGLTSDKLVGA